MFCSATNPHAVAPCFSLADALVRNECGRIHWAGKDASRRGLCLWLPLSPNLFLWTSRYLAVCLACQTAFYTLRLGDIENIFRTSGTELAHSWGHLPSENWAELKACCTLANKQRDAQFLYFIISLLQSSTCFEQRRAHHQEVKLY